MWWTKGMETPPLVTTSPQGTPQINAGVLGAPGTQILYGGDRILEGLQTGGRVQAGKWLNPCGTVGIEGEFFALGGDSEHFREWSPGDPILARPFFDVNPTVNSQSAELVAFPGLIAGSVSVDSRTELEGAGVDLRLFFSGCDNCCEGYRTDLTLGYRYLRLRDDLGVTEDLTSLTTEAPGSFLVSDTFGTKDQFNGGELGLSMAMHRDRWSLLLTPKIALGVTHETADINGSTLSTDSTGHSTISQGGLLALSSNIGSYSKDVFAVVPQGGVTLAYQLSPRLQATFGYSFLYWSRVARAGDQVDFLVNSNLLPGGTATGTTNHPAFAFNQSSYWAQGLNFGITYRR
jgi:hypothetical protein